MPKRERGRPPVHKPPERINATPEEIARAALSVPKKDKWRYMEDKARKQKGGASE